MEGDAVLRVGKIFRRQPPRHRVVFHSFQDKVGSEWWSIALHHFEVKAAHRLHLP
jgi:hypothetical protein